jgi:sensor histidine kinase YesM
MKTPKIKNRKSYLNNILWVLFIIVTATFIAFLLKGPMLFSSFSYFITYTSIAYTYGFCFAGGNWLIGSYTEKFDWTKNPNRTNLISFLLLIGYGIIMSIMIPYTIGRFLWGMTGKDLLYDVSFKALITIVLDLVVIYFYYSKLITGYLVKAIEKNEELKRENLLARYEGLKNQVNPHFLFNNLNTLSWMVEQKHELATGFIKKLSDIYRYVLDQNDKELVSIKDELKFTEDYIFLSKMRFGEGLVFSSQIKNDRNIQVVPLGIQMLVENIIKHNIKTDDMPLKIEIRTEDSFIIVKNNLQKQSAIYPGKEPLGLENIKKRYSYLSSVPVEIIESESEFIVKLPIIEH